MKTTELASIYEAIRAEKNATSDMIQRAQTVIEDVDKGRTTRKKARRTLRLELENARRG
jgi:hypothetical protein